MSDYLKGRDTMTFTTRKVLGLFCLLLPVLAAADSVRFPDDAGVLDVVRDYGARGDGVTDDTEAIQRALDDGGSNRIVYLPDGEYRISRQLRFRPSAAADSSKGGHKRSILQGQSQDGTVIRLIDHCPGFQEKPTRISKKDKEVIESGVGVIWTGTTPAQRFRNAIRNLTIDTGSGNPAASGLQFVANNQGCVRRVTIRSGDGSGHAGLDLSYTGQNGPLLVEDLVVEGFEIGVHGNAFNSATFERVTLSGQRIAGVSSNACLFFRHLESRNAVPVFELSAFYSNVVVVDSQFYGKGREGVPAITSEGRVYLRDVHIENYAEGLRHSDPEAAELAPDGRTEIVEYVSHPLTDFESGESLRLPIAEVPVIAWEHDFSKWANPCDFGAVGDGKTDDTLAIQRAIDAPGKTVLYFPNKKTFRIGGRVEVRGTIERVLGCEGVFRHPSGDRKPPGGEIVLVDGTAPSVVFERIDSMYSGVRWVHESSRTLIVASTGGEMIHRGTGDLFLTDFVGSLDMQTPGASVWARSLNTEGSEHVNVRNNGGKLWILGYKTENRNVKIETLAGGLTEVLGTHIFSNNAKPPLGPLFRIRSGSSLTVAGHRETWFGKDTPFEVYFEAGEETKWKRTQFPRGRFVSLFTIEERR